MLRLSQETIAFVGTVLAAAGFLAYLSFATEERMNQRFDAVDKRFDTVISRLTTLDTRLEALGERIARIEGFLQGRAERRSFPAAEPTIPSSSATSAVPEAN